MDARRLAYLAVAFAVFALTTIIARDVAEPRAPSIAAAQTERTGSRLAGRDRIETAIAISQAAFPDGAAAVYLSAKDVNPDALAAGSLDDGPILLVPPCGPLPGRVIDEIERVGAQDVVALGGVNAVSEQILRQAVNGAIESDLACPGAYASRTGDVELRIRPIGGRRFELSVVNHGDEAIMTGRSYTLEIYASGGFEPYGDRLPFTSEGLYVEPGESRVTNVIGPDVVIDGEQRPLPDGRYRVVKRVTVAPHVTLGVEFTLP